jgi:hypothetical protein
MFPACYLENFQTQVFSEREVPNDFKGGLSGENDISITKASHAKAACDLNDLVDKGDLVKQGELEYTR